MKTINRLYLPAPKWLVRLVVVVGLVVCACVAPLVVLSGCASAPSGAITLPRVPAWQPSSDARTFSTADVLAAISAHAPGAFTISTDATFVPVSHAWLVEAAAWSWHFTSDARLGFTPESFDCDKFALGFALAANVAASRAGVKAQPLVLRIHVMQEVAFGGVPAGGGHALNALFSDRGLFIFEPQSRTLVPFHEYPNRHRIFRVIVGG